MEKQTRITSPVVLWMAFAVVNFVSCARISSQIGLDSREDERSSGDSSSKVFVNLNEVDGRSDQTSDSFVFRPNGENGFTRAEDLKKRASSSAQDDSTKEPSACGKNIQIVLNGNGTKPSVLTCKNAVCEVTVSSHRDEEGNKITDVHVRIVKKLETDSQTNDIPVVDGVRGIEDTYSQPADFQRVNPSHPPIYYLHNDIPQIQTRYRDGQPWIQGRGTFQSPPTIWRYHRPGETAARRFPDHGGWPHNNPVVDDKIEPLSKYRGSNE
ncbi:uncharacterized protein LOC143366456 [Andrena cerasifolii]|uniref:uncharacterized protein LOC143366456 n=1 Tax=Andrena cerasifolii TaxID=2819439 RepID=UPI004038231A